jgi:hypothetical protein
VQLLFGAQQGFQRLIAFADGSDAAHTEIPPFAGSVPGYCVYHTVWSNKSKETGSIKKRAQACGRLKTGTPGGKIGAQEKDESPAGRKENRYAVQTLQ